MLATSPAEMPEENLSTNSHLSVVMTTTAIYDVQSTGADAVSSSSSHGGIFYFQWAVLVIGVVGTTANALILYAMVASKQHKKHFLIFHQNIFDLCSCLLLVIIYILKLCNIYLTGTLGYWLCMLLLSENLLWGSIVGSVINLMSITVERYLKVVHHAWSKKFLRKWMKFSAVLFAWITSISYHMAVTFLTTVVDDGVCYGYVMWKNRLAAVAYGVWTFVSFFVLVVCTFVFCYGRILIVIRRQARVMASHGGPGSSNAQSHSHQMQSNVIKTMVLVSTFYVITWMPDNVYYLLLNLNFNLTLLDVGHHVTTFIAFFYICANPFIYATKFDLVRRILARLIPCKRSQPTGENIEINKTRRTNVTTRIVY